MPERLHGRPTTIACFGEVLWDILPRGMFLGGAPLNVAYHAHQQGLAAVPISAVGSDFLGEEALRRIEGWGLATTWITRKRGLPTGTVRASIDRSGSASYSIIPNVAWDEIAVSPTSLKRLKPDVIVFGTLALRERKNRLVLKKLFEAFPNARRVLDLNLRAPFDRGSAVEAALEFAQFVKLNDEELSRSTVRPVGSAVQIEKAARRFSEAHQDVNICVTAGARGAGLLWDGAWWWGKGRRVAVRDTIGAGDAFLAGFLAAHFLRGESPARALASALRMGEFVASQDGATPPYKVDLKGRPIRSVGRV